MKIFIKRSLTILHEKNTDNVDFQYIAGVSGDRFIWYIKSKLTVNRI